MATARWKMAVCGYSLSLYRCLATRLSIQASGVELWWGKGISQSLGTFLAPRVGGYRNSIHAIGMHTARQRWHSIAASRVHHGLTLASRNGIISRRHPCFGGLHAPPQGGGGVELSKSVHWRVSRLHGLPSSVSRLRSSLPENAIIIAQLDIQCKHFTNNSFPNHLPLAASK